MRVLACLVLAASLLQADVEIVTLNDESDVSFVSWVGSDECAHLGRFEGDSLVVEITTVGDYDASVGICEFEPDSYIVLYITSDYTTYWDTLQTLMPTTLSRLGSWPLEGFQEHVRYGFLKSPDPRWDALLTIFAYSFCSSITLLDWTSMELSVSPSGEVDSLFCLSYQYKDTGSGADWYDYLDFCGPVCDEDGWPVFCTSEMQPGGSMWPSGAVLRSLVHNPPSDSTGLLVGYIYGAWDSLPDWPPAMMALGSCFDETIALWEDDYGQVHYSGFDCLSPEPVSTAMFPWSRPREEDGCALSADPQDEGMLLAWYQTGEIRCRHYEDGWNGYDHIAKSGVGLVDVRNMAVSSVVDGYWIAYLENGADEPGLVFVDRSVVTGIENAGCQSKGPSLDIFPNPCSSMLFIAPCGISPSGSGKILIHDCSGRLVREMPMEDPECGLSWDCFNEYHERCEAGVYFVTLIDNNATVTEKLLLLN